MEKALAGTLGVLKAYVNPATEMAYLEYDPSTISPEEMAAVVRAAGFGVETPIPLN